MAQTSEVGEALALPACSTCPRCDAQCWVSEKRKTFESVIFLYLTCKIWRRGTNIQWNVSHLIRGDAAGLAGPEV